MPKFAVVLPAAGRSTRFQHQRRKKPFVELQGRPIWLRSLEPFLKREDVVQSLLVISPDDLEWFRERFAANLAFLDLELVPGGAERADSVQQALARVRADVDFVAVHDAARPLIAAPWIDAVFRAAQEHGAAIPGIEVTHTLKRVDAAGNITETVPRTGLWQAQTPQVFARDLLLQAYAKRDGFVATDEAQLVERIGGNVHVVPGSPVNIKITNRDDFDLAQALLAAVPQEKPKWVAPFEEDDDMFP